MTSQHKTYKIVVVGEIGVGKTSLIKKYTTGLFTENYKATIGVDFATKQIENKETKEKTILQLWDIAGQERFGNMTRVYVREARGVVIVADLTRSQTIEGAKRWNEQIDNIINYNDQPLPKYLLLNKRDIKDQDHINDYDLDQLCKEYGFIGCKEISVKDDLSFDDIFNELLNKINIMNVDRLDNLLNERIDILMEPTSKKGGCCSG